VTDWTIIANPVSGGGRGRKAGEAVRSRLSGRGLKANLTFTQGRGDAARIASEALASGCRQFAVCGGDGTVHEAVGVLAGSDAALGIVPCGRGNDLARALGIPRDVAGAADVLVSGVARRIDLGRIGDRYFGTVACLGFDSEVARRVFEGRVPLSGTAGYVWAVLRTLLTYGCPVIRLEGDFGVFKGPVLLAATGNTPFYGGGMKVTPQAACDDGLLDVCIVEALSRLAVLRFFPTVFSGRHVHLPSVQMRRTRSLRVETREPLWIFADGQPVCRTPATIEVAERALTVLCPAQIEPALPHPP